LIDDYLDPLAIDTRIILDQKQPSAELRNLITSSIRTSRREALTLLLPRARVVISVRLTRNGSQSFTKQQRAKGVGIRMWQPCAREPCVNDSVRLRLTLKQCGPGHDGWMEQATWWPMAMPVLHSPEAQSEGTRRVRPWRWGPLILKMVPFKRRRRRRWVHQIAAEIVCRRCVRSP